MKIALSGTPMENHYGEFYSLVDLVVPGALGDYDKFKKQYQVSVRVAEREFFDPQNIEFLKLKTRPIVMRRRKIEVMDQLPEKIESDIYLDFDKKQEKIYRDIAIACNASVQQAIKSKGEVKSQIEMLSALLKLRQVCSSPKLLRGIDYNLDADKRKALDLFLEYIKKL
jgi:SNF2 family DNA or RNA helicase